MNSRTILLLCAFLLAGCGGIAYTAPMATQAIAPSTRTPLAPQPTWTDRPVPTASPTITPTMTSPPAATPTWAVQGPGDVKVPILLYHHIAVPPANSLYYVTPDRFDDEMRLLHNWEYTAITTSMLVEAITQGASLPPRPIIITFDDAWLDNYTAAFPIMKKYGFTGVLYLPYTYIGAPCCLSVDQVKEMAAAGWEVGSHTLTHPNLLALDSAILRAEVVDSRKKLEALLGLPVLTFAYPFANVDSAAVDYVHFAGYIAAMDAKGFTADQGEGNLFALQREEIRGTEDAKTFIRFLPWLGDPIYLPTDTPTVTPRPTRTPIPTYTQYPTRTPKPSSTP